LNSGTGTQATGNNPPTFPSPGGTGSTGNSQPPPVTVTVQPTATATATQQTPTSTPSTGTLTVQITNIPPRVRANSTVDVSVLTSEPGVTVRLSITYTAPPFQGITGSRTTDGNGNAIIPWHPTVFALNNKFVTATVIAIARDQNGQMTKSAPAQVTIVVGGGGG
ncbi:MAG: hypothetical protein M3Z24_00535, partial [Chloroflexota bacterium]|nr:hypothetical protein [Chloroflexota bacterium]